MKEEQSVDTSTHTPRHHTDPKNLERKHMVKVKSQEPPPYEPVEPGEYKAKLSELEEELEGKFGPQVRFTFEILDDEDYKGQTVRGWCSLKLDDEGDFTFWEGTKLWDWVAALRSGNTVATNEDFELDDLVGSTCRIMIVTKKKMDGTPTDKIDNVLPPKKGKAAGSNKKQSEMEAEEDFDAIPF